MVFEMVQNGWFAEHDRSEMTDRADCSGFAQTPRGGLVRNRIRRSRFTSLAVVVLTSTVLGTGSVTAKAPAQAASSDRVLILAGTVTGGAASVEGREAAANGLAVDVIDGATWKSKTAAEFASYRAIILGDPTCSTITADVEAAVENAKTWGSVLNGNIVITGTDPVFHASQGGATLTQRAIDFAVAKAGKTGAYISLSCYYHGTATNTPVPLLSGIGDGGFRVMGVGCYNNAHIVAESPVLAGLTDANLSNWSCSVHEAFQTWPGALIPLAIARDFDSSFTASDGSQGPPYILAGGDIKSFPLSLEPLSGSAPARGSHTVKAQLLDGTTRAPVVDARIGFGVTSGPNAGVSGACSPATCLTDREGHVSFSYRSGGTIGDDVIQAFLDKNVNGKPDLGEPRTTAGMHWTKPSSVPGTFGGAWPYGGSSLTLYYSYGGGHRYLGNVYQGGVNWNAGTKVRIHQWPGIPYAIHIPISDVDVRDTWWGMTVFADDCVKCTYTRNAILLNRPRLDPENDFIRTKVATHEFGHAIGLEHPNDAGIKDRRTRSVMWQGILSYNTPQSYDITRTNGLYP